jgi:hypothetical protein
MTTPSKTGGARPRTPDDIAALCRIEFETFGASFRQLEAKYNVPRSTLCKIAKRAKWNKKPNTPVGVQYARDITAQILAAGLRRVPLGHESVPPEIQTGGNPVDRPLEPNPAGNADPAAPAGTADMLDFPAMRQGVSKLAGPVQLLPDRTPEEKAQLRITLGAIRAMMSVEQSQLLDHHLSQLLRYGHLIDVYIEPAKFVPDDMEWWPDTDRLGAPGMMRLDLARVAPAAYRPDWP